MDPQNAPQQLQPLRYYARYYEQNAYKNFAIGDVVRAPIADIWGMVLPDKVYCHTGIYIGGSCFISKYCGPTKIACLRKEKIGQARTLGCDWTKSVLLKKGHMKAAERAMAFLAEYQRDKNKPDCPHLQYSLLTNNCHHFTDLCWKLTKAERAVQNFENTEAYEHAIRTMTMRVVNSDQLFNNETDERFDGPLRIENPDEVVEPPEEAELSVVEHVNVIYAHCTGGFVEPVMGSVIQVGVAPRESPADIAKSSRFTKSELENSQHLLHTLTNRHLLTQSSR